MCRRELCIIAKRQEPISLQERACKETKYPRNDKYVCRIYQTKPATENAVLDLTKILVTSPTRSERAEHTELNTEHASIWRGFKFLWIVQHEKGPNFLHLFVCPT